MAKELIKVELKNGLVFNGRKIYVQSNNLFSSKFLSLKLLSSKARQQIQIEKKLKVVNERLTVLLKLQF